MMQSVWKTVWQLLRKLNIELSSVWLNSSNSGYTLKRTEKKMCSCKNSYTDVHSSIKVKRWKNPKDQHWGVDKQMWSIHRKEYYLAIKRNEIIAQATTRMGLENTMLSGVNQEWEDLQNRSTHKRKEDQWFSGVGGMGEWGRGGCKVSSLQEWWTLSKISGAGCTIP